MSGTAAKQRRRRWGVRLPVLIVAAAAVFLAVTSAQIVYQGEREEARPADAIVVFGAAEYVGHPSPVFRARLDHAYGLFQGRLAPVVITTGGYGADPTYSEGGVGRDYLISRGVPERSLIAETQSANTAQSAERVAVIMKANGMRTCVAVSDAYHVFRIKRLLEGQGVVVYTSARPGSLPPAAWQRALAVLREAASYLLWRLHLSQLFALSF